MAANTRAVIWGAAITAAATIIAAVILVNWTRAPIETQYSGRLFNALDRNKPVAGAIVHLEVDQNIPQTVVSDSEGIFNFKTIESSGSVRIRIEAAGYEPFDKNVLLNRTGLEYIYLKPILPVPLPSPSTTPKIAGKGLRRREQQALRDLNR
jgi:hypothetical protein